MKKNILPLLLVIATAICCNYKLTAQNLVLNPSFENTSSCPQGISEFYLATNWTSTNTGADSCSSPDLYAACAPSFGGVNVPNALLGYHQARTGTHFAGIILGDGFVGCIPLNDNYREYIEGTLSAPLVAGQNYAVRFYMSLADGVMWGSNSVGVYFSNTQYLHNACSSGQLIPHTPQLNMCGPAIMDTVNWIPVDWIYTATGGEQYFTIGNFKTDANTNHVTHNCSSFNPYIYYYIDDVTIEPVGPNECGVSLQLDSVSSTCGTNNGKISVTANGCTSPFTYAWSNGATTAEVQNVGPGTYTVTVTNSSNCHETASASLSSTPLSISTTGTNPSCGSNTGSATVTASNGTGPYTYNWSNGGTSATISNLGTGSYYVTVTGASGCLAHDSISLLSSSGFALTATSAGASCGSSNGTATATINGGTPPFSFTWSNGQTTQTATNLAPGNYSVTVTGDTSSAPFFSENFTSGGTGWTLNTPGTGTNGNSANQWIVNSDNNCTCGSGNYLHITPTSNTSCFICLPQAGQCTYLALAAAFGEGDFTTDIMAISPVISTLGKSNITLTFNYEALGTPGSDYGQVSLSNNGGTTWTPLPTHYQDSSTCSQATVSIPLNYQNIANFRFAFEWKNAPGSFGGSQGNPPGFVIDNVALTAASSNCPAIASVTVPATGGLTVALASADPSCGQKNGSVTVNVTQGTGPFNYAWNNGGPTQTINNLGPGIYTVTVTNNSGCSATATTTLHLGNGTISATPSSTNATCGNNNGTASVAAIGAQSYTYDWSNGATTDTITGLSAGTYHVTVTGTGGCTAVGNVTVTASNSLGLTPAAGATTCGNNNGTASVTVTSGTGPYTYTWSNGATTSSLSNLTAGSYNVTVLATGGCSATASTTVSSSTNLSVSATGGSTGCTSTGTASVSVNTGSGPYTYAWNNGATTASLSSLSAGTYTVTVTGAAGCSATASAAVTSTGGGITLTPSSTAASCTSNTGSASVNTTTGTGPFTYLWNNGATTSSVSNLGSGNYTVTVTGNGGCSATANINVSVSGSLSLTASATNTTCGNNNGSVTATISGGGAYTYNWSNGSTTATVSNLAAGIYTVTALSSGGCSATASATINPSGGTVNIQAQSSTICPGDTTQICAPAGYAAYHWNLGETSQCINATAAGNYYVTVTDNGNCTATSNHITVTVNTPPTVSFTQRVDTLTATGAASYQWYFNNAPITGATNSTFVASQEGNYYVQGTDANGCKANSSVQNVKLILGISQVNNTSNIAVYPNPLAVGSWHIDVTNDWIGANCEVYDAAGRVIYQTEIKNNQNEFELEVAQGVYLMRVSSAQKVYTIKLIKL